MGKGPVWLGSKGQGLVKEMVDKHDIWCEKGESEVGSDKCHLCLGFGPAGLCRPG